MTWRLQAASPGLTKAAIQEKLVAYCSDQVSVWAGSLAGAPRSERSVSDHSKTRQRSIVENLRAVSQVSPRQTPVRRG